MVRISALGWASNLRNLSEMNFSQLYDYPVVSREYRHIVLRGARITGSTTEAVQYGLESEAKAVAL